MIPKFRAWDKENNEMLYPDDTDKILFEINEYGITTYDVRYLDEYGSFSAELDSVVMQSTGLKDKNGKEIFEGDITKVHEFIDFGGVEGEKEIIGVVKYGCVYEFPIKEWYLETKYDCSPLTYMNLHEESFEILGNIYEHSHLLGED